MGFKTFADRTDIEFRFPLLALVGPNGCGKSNVVDAIRWVLGETSAKQIRGQKKDDVIFLGSEHRKAVNVADVTIQLNNERNILPLDYPEVHIRRRLFRNGENEFFLNGNPILLKDLRALLSGTGIGVISYAIFQQGKIDQILSHKAEERRTYFEEAAGITGYKLRWQETERRLLKVRENVARIHSRLRTGEIQANNLRVQSEHAKKYQEIHNHMFELDVQIKLHELKKTKKDLQILEKKKKLLIQKRNTIREKTTQQETLSQRIYDEVKKIEHSLQHVNEEQVTTAVITARREEKKKNLSSQIEELQKREYTANTVLVDQEEKMQEVQVRIGKQETVLVHYSNLLDEVLEKEKDLQKNIKGVELDKDKCQSAEQRCGQLIIETQKEQRELHYKLARLVESLIELIDNNLLANDAYRRHEAEKQVDNKLSIMKQKLHNLLQVKQSISKQTLSQLHDEFLELEKALQESRALFPHVIEKLVAPDGLLTQKKQLESDLRILHKKEEQLQNEKLVFLKRDKSLSIRQKKLHEQLRSLQLLVVRKREEEKSCKTVIEHLQQQRMEWKQQRERIQEDLETYQLRITRLMIELEQTDFSKENRKRNEELLLKMKELQQEKKHQQEQYQHIIEKNKQFIDEEQIYEQQIHQLDLKVIQEKTKADVITDQFFQKYARQLNDYEYKGHNIQQLIKEHKELDNELKRLGNINFLAAEQMTDLDKEMSHMRQQYTDLLQSSQELQRILDEANTEAATVFHTHLHRIDQEFSKVFQSMFQGGHAAVHASDSDNILESGIEIVVQTPGKKSVNISHLSGGERTLAAIALMLATFLVRPAPFCILDEVDAMLDNVNTQLFVQHIVQYANQTQFIIVTHNVLTISAMQAAIGITMQEPGISTVSSVAFNA